MENTPEQPYPGEIFRQHLLLDIQQVKISNDRNGSILVRREQQV